MSTAQVDWVENPANKLWQFFHSTNRAQFDYDPFTAKPSCLKRRLRISQHTHHLKNKSGLTKSASKNASLTSNKGKLINRFGRTRFSSRCVPQLLLLSSAFSSRGSTTKVNSHLSRKRLTKQELPRAKTARDSTSLSWLRRNKDESSKQYGPEIPIRQRRICSSCSTSG